MQKEEKRGILSDVERLHCLTSRLTACVKTYSAMSMCGRHVTAVPLADRPEGSTHNMENEILYALTVAMWSCGIDSFTLDLFLFSVNHYQRAIM